MVTKRGTGTMAGVIALFFLLLPMCLLFVSDPDYYELVILGIYPISWLFTIFCVGLARSLLGSSTVFGALFISSGLLNL